MTCVPRLALAGVASASLCGAAWADIWPEFSNQSSTRIIASPSLVLQCGEEKDYAWGDLNNNGRIDLIVVRKQPFSTPGRRVNVLLMNEGIAEGHSINGVLVDRTALYASAADDGGQGFLDETNDRDVIIIDLNNDGWRDVVTSTAYGTGLPKTISHPRTYMNQGNSGGNWVGLRYEQARIPQLAQAPNTCAVAGGDVTGNGFPDLYFVTYNSTFNDFLLVNNGAANFANETTTRLPSGFVSSGFGTAGAIVDMNGNGWRDIVKSENGPVKIAYNNANGVFTSWHTPSQSAHYHMSVGDLNNNGRMDIVISDDGTDRVALNQGPSSGQATFISVMLPQLGGGGFSGNSVIVDLNNNGWNDLLIADVDVDIPGCNRTSNIHRNNANPPNVTFTRDYSNIPTSMMVGVYDFAVFDINGDGWKDIVVGRCQSTQVWMSIPPVSVAITYPNGRPDTIVPNSPTEIAINLAAVGGSVTGAWLHTSINGGAFSATPIDHEGGETWTATLPASDCGSSLRYYVEVQMGATVFVDPAGAPQAFYSAIATVDFETNYTNDFDGAVTGWTVWNDPSLTGGARQQAVPLAVISGGRLSSPDGDNSPNAFGQAFITQNCLPGQTAGQCDLDWGPTILTSPVIDLEGTNGIITYDRWVFCSTWAHPLTADFLYTEVSNNDGETWVPVHHTGDTQSEWQTVSFLVSDYVTPTSTVRVRFVIEDAQNNSITNAVIDNFRVEQCVCGTPVCTGDLNNSGAVDVQDLLILL
ncbi:MAG TPA: VCBS repeat-containing protein, partial [Phycisphaerales bacterium]|nr:VCBS repeat-containing protein [Phycisphaerales bacterium]